MTFKDIKKRVSLELPRQQSTFFSNSNEDDEEESKELFPSLENVP
ncbi:MAG: hypothetical protein ACJ72V_20775 [Nitrososphaeraceae archaeon]